jgi:hypothetical protein
MAGHTPIRRIVPRVEIRKTERYRDELQNIQTDVRLGIDLDA